MSESPRQGPTGSTREESSWRQRDTAVYVVSTLNVTRASRGRPAVTVVREQLQVTRFAVYADQTQRDLYFIDLLRQDRAVAGTLVYRMGWPRPQSITSSTTDLGIQPADARFAQAYRTDARHLIGMFASTSPA